MKLSPHFDLSELVDSDTATRLKIDNTPSLQVIQNLAQVAQGLEKVRTLLGNKPIKINSGYRCPPLNEALKGAANSAHLAGWAADFVCPDYGIPFKVIQAIIKSGISFDKCINENTWVHLSFDPRKRKQVFTAIGNEVGKTFYMPGL